VALTAQARRALPQDDSQARMPADSCAKSA